MGWLTNKPPRYFPKAPKKGEMLWIGLPRIPQNITVDCEECSEMVIFKDVEITAIGTQQHCKCGHVIKVNAYRP